MVEHFVGLSQYGRQEVIHMDTRVCLSQSLTQAVLISDDPNRKFMAAILRPKARGHRRRAPCCGSQPDTWQAHYDREKF
jgi:hypothetical protein